MSKHTHPIQQATALRPAAPLLPATELPLLQPAPEHVAALGLRLDELSSDAIVDAAPAADGAVLQDAAITADHAGTSTIEPLPALEIGPLAWVDRAAPDGVTLATGDNDEGVLLNPAAGGYWSAAALTAIGVGAVAALAGGGGGSAGAGSGPVLPNEEDPIPGDNDPDPDDGNGSQPPVTTPNEAPVGADASGREAFNHRLTSIGPIDYFDAEGDALESITITGFDFDVALPGQSLWTILGDSVYILQQAPNPLNFWQAGINARDGGGHLAWIQDEATMDALLAAFGGRFSGSETFDQPAVFNEGGNGDATYIGLAQDTGAALLPTDGWKWASGVPALNWGPDFTTPSFWRAGEPNDVDGNENDEENVAALIDGVDANDRAIIGDHPDMVGNVRYLIERPTPLRYGDGSAVKIGDVIAAEDLADLQWDGLGSNQGSFSYTMTAASGTQSTAEYQISFVTEVIGMLPNDSNLLA